MLLNHRVWLRDCIRCRHAHRLLHSLHNVHGIRLRNAHWLDDLLVVVLVNVTDRVDNRGMTVTASITADNSASVGSETGVTETGITDTRETEGAAIVTGWLRLRLSEHCSGQQCDELCWGKRGGKKGKKEKAVPNYWSVEIIRELDKTENLWHRFARLIQAAVAVNGGVCESTRESREALVADSEDQ